MLRKTMVALMAIASVSILTIDAASAQRGIGGGGFHGGGGGFHGGGGFRSAAIGGAPLRHSFAAAPFHGGFQDGFRQHHQRFPSVAATVGFGLGYGAWRSYYDSGYPYYAGYYDDAYYYGSGGCHIVRQRVLTPVGWRIRPVQVCG